MSKSNSWRNMSNGPQPVASMCPRALVKVVMTSALVVSLPSEIEPFSQSMNTGSKRSISGYKKLKPGPSSLSSEVSDDLLERRLTGSEVDSIGVSFSSIAARDADELIDAAPGS